MQTSSDISTRATLIAGRATDLSSPSTVSNSTDETTGNSFTSDSTETETTPTPTETEECDLEFLFQDGDRHPVGLLCRTHDMAFDIGNGI